MTDVRDMSGALFKNLQREKDTHPHYRGDITIEGRKYWLSAWIKEGKKGKYMSLAVKPAEEQKPARNAYADVKAGHADPLEDEVPF